MFAHGIFTFSIDGSVTQTLVFEYIDETGYYWSISKPLMSREKNIFKSNMQFFLDQEEVYINGVRVYPRVKEVIIRSLTPNTLRVIFLIRFKGELRKGENIYENIYDEEIAEYPFYAVWFLPETSRIIDARFGVRFFVDNDRNILYFFVDKGARVGGKESIVFLV